MCSITLKLLIPNHFFPNQILTSNQIVNQILLAIFGKLKQKEQKYPFSIRGCNLLNFMLR